VRRASQTSTIDSQSPHRPGRFGLGSLVGPASPAPKTRFIRYAKLRHSLHRCSVTSSPRHPRRSLIGRRPVNSTIPFGSVSLRLMQRTYVMAAKRPRPSIPISDAPRASSSFGKTAACTPGFCRDANRLPSGPSDPSSGLAYGAAVSRPRRRGREVRHAVRRKASNCRFGPSRRLFCI
jgi:hypothetical protein